VRLSRWGSERCRVALDPSRGAAVWPAGATLVGETLGHVRSFSRVGWSGGSVRCGTG
jgi:hypothetical protein